ncbi:MAG: prepilin peptidase [Bifidobacteriaceae bacterium]|nr:prepilin peptidase [Bifidobacteriaceae bacterium]
MLGGLTTTDGVILEIVAFIVGCILGSFLGVVIWRVPNHISIVNPKRSFCPNCNAQIAWYDNIPLLSYAVLRGKCRHCKEPISVRYPIMEALTGCAMAAVVAGALWQIYPAWLLPNMLYLAAISIVVAYIDIDHHLILNVIVYPSYLVSLALLVLASAMMGNWEALKRGLICALILFVFYFVLSLIWPGGMGDGDIKLAFLLGMTLGWLGWKQFIVGAFMAFFVGGLVVLIQLTRKKVSVHGGIPFGPSMVVGTWIGIFAGQVIADLYLQLVGLA